MTADVSLPGWLLYLLPAMFLLHDTEEAIFLPGWLRRHGAELSQRFPRLSRRLLPHLSAISRRRFLVMAAEEFVLLLCVTVYARFSGVYEPWLALYMAFGLHLTVHIVQWIAAGRYVPSAATSLVALVCFGAGLYRLIDSGRFTLREYVLCAAAGCAVTAVNLLLLHAAARFRGRKPIDAPSRNT